VIIFCFTLAVFPLEIPLVENLYYQHIFFHLFLPDRWKKNMHMVAQLVEVLCYKPEGHRLDSQWRHWNFPLTYSFWPHYGPASIEHVTEMSTWGVKVSASG
jgi:hypothetical protein